MSAWIPHANRPITTRPIRTAPPTIKSFRLIQAPYFVLPEYRDIEWLEIPAEIRWQAYENAPFSRTELDLSRVRGAPESVGKFELEQSEHGLRLYGYRP